MSTLCKILLFIVAIYGTTINFYGYADVASLEGAFVAGEADVVGHLNRDRTTLTNSINNIRGAFAGTAQSSGQIKADTLGEENMADDANPRIRTNEGASCADLVVSGLLPTTTSGTLTGSIPAGRAYPDGYRVNKDSATARQFTASRWTFVDLDINGSFQYSEVAIGAATPSVAANSARIARVSTDTTQISNVQDLRTTSCATGPFSAIKDSSTEASLSDMYSYGAWVRRYSPTGRTPAGWAQGLFVSWDTTAQFIVTPGSALINGEYRFVSVNVTVPTTNDAPTDGTSGLDTGAIAASTRYYVYAVADQPGTASLSISFSTNASAPTGITNYRLLGSIVTDATSLFTSRDVMTVHGVTERELIGGSVFFDGLGSSASLKDSFNVSAVATNGTGDYTITWDIDFNNNLYELVCSSEADATPTELYCTARNSGVSADSARILIAEGGGTQQNGEVRVIASGDKRV